MDCVIILVLTFFVWRLFAASRRMRRRVEETSQPVEHLPDIADIDKFIVLKVSETPDGPTPATAMAAGTGQ